MDPAKLKVVELRSELAARGLDTKGNKAVLVERLQEALDKESAKGEGGNTSVAESSAGDTSKADMEDKDEKNEESQEEEKMEAEEEDGKEDEDEEEDEKEDEKAEDDSKSTKENGDHSEEKEDKKDEKPAEKKEGEKEDGSKAGDSAEKRGEKRKHSSPSPSRGPRRRSRTPIKEDEPLIDYDKVQLNWYDSDLHLQVDKENFTSAKPYHDGAFGYVWAGVRATHGVDSGKVSYEVKITEELKWEDVLKQSERGRRDRDRDTRRGRYDRDRHSSRHDDRKKDKSKDAKTHDKDKAQNGKDEEKKEEAKDESSAEKKADDAEKTEEKNDSDEATTESNAEDAEKTEEPKPEEKVEKMEEDPAPKVDDEAAEESKDEKTEETKEEKPEETKDDGEKKEKDEKMEVEESKEPPPEPIPTHLIRIGWSLVSCGLQLGEEKYSYGFESSAKFVTDKEFSDYGVKFGVGDVVGSYVDFGEDAIKITYTVNGEAQSTALEIPRDGLPEGFALFPHILTRNYAFETNLGNKEEPFFAHPEECNDYVFLDKVEDMIGGPMRPEKRADCEVIMMCGLPASGKTHWVKDHVEKNPEKRYTVIGNTQLLDKMTVNGNPLKNSFKDRWNSVLDKLQRCLNKLTDIACTRRRNYIIDQTNVFPSAQRRKMRSFEGFKRRAVVVVVGEEEQTKRQQQKEAQDGKDVPSSAILEMKANMSLPKVGDWIEEVTYAELDEAEAKTAVQKYNTQGREAGFGPIHHSKWQRFRDNRGPPRWHDRRDYYRGGGGGGGGYRDNRGYDRYDSRGGRPSGGWHNQRSSGGWNRDRRDRGPPPPSRDWHNNNRGGGRGRDFDRGVRDGRISRNQRMGGGGGYGGRQGGGGGRQAPWQGGWGGQGSGGGNWGQGPYKQRYF